MGYKFLSKEKNLNLLNTEEVIKILKELNIYKYEIHYNKFLFLNSNILIIIRKGL